MLFHRRARWLSAAVGALISIAGAARFVYVFGATLVTVAVAAVALALVGAAYYGILKS
jgi:hypothetical protein